MHSGAKIHMMIVALDYPGTGNELTATDDGNNMFDMVQCCGGVDSLVKLYNNDGNYDKVAETIKAVGKKCQPGDFFVFNYAGHGANVADKDGDEADGQDEALCLVTPDGKLDFDKFMTDDDFAELVTTNVQPGVNILIMCDCCHSGTIGDFENEEWDGHKAISMSGCKDSQTSGDTGRGGIWTHSLLLAIQQMQEDDNDDYSLAQLYNVQLEKDDDTFHSEQDIQLKWTKECGAPENMAWPFIPDSAFVAPWNNKK